MSGPNCDIYHRDVSGTDHLAHKTTGARICREAKITLHSPKDFVRTK